MQMTLKLLLAAGALALATTASADERIEHFEGEPAETLEQAVANFSEYNARLAEILAKEELTARDLGTIHELTYTLENALGKINRELDDLAETLETLHLASERAEYERALESGRDYLDTAGKLID